MSNDYGSKIGLITLKFSVDVKFIYLSYTVFR